MNQYFVYSFAFAGDTPGNGGGGGMAEGTEGGATAGLGGEKRKRERGGQGGAVGSRRRRTRSKIAKTVAS